MAAPSNLASLLVPKTADAKQDPYSLLGLRAGERDLTVIATAIKSTIAGLNEAKPSTDPAIWNQAALRVKEARAILTDPERKARLDRSLADSPSADSPLADEVRENAAQRTSPNAIPPTPPMANPLADPLAGLLPSQASAAPRHADVGLRTATPSPAFRAGRSAPSGTSGNALQGSPTMSVPPPLPPAPSHFPPPTPVLGETGVTPIPTLSKPVSPRRRKKGFPWVGVFLVLLTVGCLGGIVGLVYLLTQSPQGLSITIQPGGPAVAPPDNASGVSTTAPEIPTGPRAPRQPVDPIMRPPERSRANMGKPLDPAEVTGSPAAPSEMDTDAMNDDAMMGDVMADSGVRPETPAVIPDSPTPEVATATPNPPLPAPNAGNTPSVVDPTRQQLETAAKSLEAAREAIRRADWDQMQALTTAAVRDAATADQKAQATRWEQLAELATYYYGGVQKGLDGLGAGKSFNVTESLQVVVVETGPSKLTIRFNARNKEYPRDELPLVIAERVARFALPTDSPSTAAGAEVYKAIAKITTPQYRQAAIRALEAMEEVPDELSPSDLVAAIKDIFGE
jgi:hypothetical protein